MSSRKSGQLYRNIKQFAIERDLNVPYSARECCNKGAPYIFYPLFSSSVIRLIMSIPFMGSVIAMSFLTLSLCPSGASGTGFLEKAFSDSIALKVSSTAVANLAYDSPIVTEMLEDSIRQTLGRMIARITGKSASREGVALFELLRSHPRFYIGDNFIKRVSNEIEFSFRNE